MLGVAVGARDPVAALLCWSLAHALAQQGATVTLLASVARGGAPLWPRGGGPAGRLHFVPSDTTRAEWLLRDAAALAVGAAESRLVIVAVPPEWLLGDGLEGENWDGPDLPWLLALLASGERGRQQAGRLLRRAADQLGTQRAAVLAHRAFDLESASDEVESLAEALADRLPAPLERLGVLPDDLAVYRAIAARQPLQVPADATGSSGAAGGLTAVASRVLRGAGIAPRPTEAPPGDLPEGAALPSPVFHRSE